MATTDTRPGFRLPWSADHRPAEVEPATGEPASPLDSDGDAAVASGSTVATDPTGSAASPVGDSTTTGASATTTQTTARPPVTARPTKFLADLTKAMQVAAQAERDEMLAHYQAEAKSFVEQINAESSGRAAEYRKQADEDVAGIRDWAKAEQARIREETDRRTAVRKADLEAQLARHATRVEQEIERIQSRIGEYEDEMSRFFERLVVVDDPGKFAAMAASMPEPPPFEVDFEAAPVAPIPNAAASVPAESVLGTTATTDVEPVAETAAPDAAGDTATQVADDAVAAEIVAAEIAAAAATESLTETVSAVDDPPSDQATDAGSGAIGDAEADPRFAALGLTPDFAAAEAEAAVDATTTPGGERPDRIALSDDDALAARLAAIPPAESSEPAHSGTVSTTQVSVVGLVSVASIAGFKRHLARVPGVQSVSVSSGPDGEFLFTAVHHDDVVLREIVPTLPGFQARVSSAGDGIVNVTAHDPESQP